MELKKIYEKALKSTFDEQWKKIITVGSFGEHDAMLPGIIREGNGSEITAIDTVLSNGSKILVPENTAAIILNNGEIESILEEAGGYELQEGEQSLLNNDGFIKAIVERVASKLEFRGESENKKSIVYVNRREIKNITFGLETPVLFHDPFYEIDFELYSYGSFSAKTVDVYKFVTDYIPANTYRCSLNDKMSNNQLIGEFKQAYMEALSSLSGKCKYSELQSKISDINSEIINNQTVKTWKCRFGLELTRVAIDSIVLSDESRAIVNAYAKKKTDVTAYANVSNKASNIAVQQKLAEGIREGKMRSADSVIVTASLSQLVNKEKSNNSLSIDEQLTLLKKLKEAKDSGIINDSEFEKKKKEILDL